MDRSELGDRRQTTCYMCACRCGINVYVDPATEQITYIEGNRDHPVNRGVLCAKGSAGIRQHYSPARLEHPLRRVGPRGSGKFEQVTWDEALGLATDWLAPLKSNPKKLAFFTGRDQSQSLTSWWAQQFGTPNYAAHGGFCSVNMAAAGIYTIGGSFWEFGSPDWERTELFVMFGVAEDHDSNPLKIGIGELKKRGGRFVSVNPVRTGYSAVADDWLGIRPGTDGLLVLSLVHELFRLRKIDIDYLLRYTNVPWLVIDSPDDSDDGLFARDSDGVPLVWDKKRGGVASSSESGLVPNLTESVTLPDGRSAKSVMCLLAEEYTKSDYSPDTVSKHTDISASRIRSLAREIATVAFEREIVIEREWVDMKGERHTKFVGRPVSMHAMRGISAHSNGFQTARAIHLLQVLIGSIDCPGGFRYKPPYPKPYYAHPKPHCFGSEGAQNGPLAGPHLGYPHGPEDLLLMDNGCPGRLDKAYTWDAPLAAHGLMHMVIPNAHSGDPYKIDTLFMYMANMAWNSSMNTSGVIDYLTARDSSGDYVIPHIIYSDAYYSEMVMYADLILPDTTYLERYDCISLLDRPISEPDLVCDAIRWPVVSPDLSPDRDVRGFQSVLLDLGHRLGLPGMTNDDGSACYSDYADYITRHERRPGIGPLSGWRGSGDSVGRGDPNPSQLDSYRDNGSFFRHPIPPEAQFFKHANRAWQDFAVSMGFFDSPQPVTFQLYLEPLQKFRLSARGHGDRVPPEHLRSRIEDTFCPLPCWYSPLDGASGSSDSSTPSASPDSSGSSASSDYPYYAVTQRPMAMYHSWGSQNSWLRQIHAKNVMYVPSGLCREKGLEKGDWAWITSRHGRIRVRVEPMDAVNAMTMWTWNSIGKKRGAWGLTPDSPESREGFLVNHLIDELLPPRGDSEHRLSNSDPITGQASWYDLRVDIERAADSDSSDTLTHPQFDEVTE